MKHVLAASLTLIAFTAQADFNVPELCAKNAHQTVLDDARIYLALRPEFLETATPEAILASTIRSRELAPWLLQDPSRKNIAVGAYYVQGKLASDFAGRLEPSSKIEEILTTAASHPATYGDTTKAHSDMWLRQIKNSPGDAGLARVRANAFLLCAPYVTAGCTDALVDAIDTMDNRAVNGIGAWVSLPSVVARILKDDGITQGAAHFALKFLKRLRQAAEYHQTPATLIDDMRASFIATGSTPEQAEDRTWILLGMFGSRGSSVALLDPMFTKENLPVQLALHLFTASMAMIDFDVYPQGQTYSVPGVVRSHCNYGYPYHFWLSAYLTRTLIQKGHSLKAAMVGVHLIGKLYEFGSGTMTRENERPYRDKFFNNYNISLQKNVAHNDAGVFFAAGAKDVDLNHGLNVIFSEAKPMPELSREELEKGIRDETTRYGWFNRVIAPDAWFNKKLGINASPGLHQVPYGIRNP